jgi:epoxyqueuosine reductase QueG
MDMKKKNYDLLKRFSEELGFGLFGVAEFSAQGLPRAVCMAAGLSDAVLEDIPDHPTRPYFHHYKTVNMFLDQSAYRMAMAIQQKGYKAFPVAASQILDWEKQTGLLSHKHVAVLAGLGWIGRNNLLVNRAIGARLRLVTVLTDMPLKADKPVKDGCGSCRACMAACPAGAIKDDAKDFDHQGCFAKLKEFLTLRYTEQFVCGVCAKACKGRTAQAGGGATARAGRRAQARAGATPIRGRRAR